MRVMSNLRTDHDVDARWVNIEYLNGGEEAIPSISVFSRGIRYCEMGIRTHTYAYLEPIEVKA